MMRVLALLVLALLSAQAETPPSKCARGEYCKIAICDIRDRVVIALQAVATTEADPDFEIEQSESRRSGCGYIVALGIPQEAPLGKYALAVKYWAEGDESDYPSDGGGVEFEVVNRGPKR